jgi:hypothetical protein
MNEQIVKDFGWLGKVVDVCEVRDYTIVEYLEKDFDTKEITDNHFFGVYVGGKNTNTSYGSFDEVLAGAIAYKHEGPNHHADYYFMKSLRPDETR